MRRRWYEANRAACPTTLKNLPSRAQSSNAAFARRPTRAFRECIEDPAGSYQVYCNRHPRLAGVPRFTDAKGWYPGLELRGEDLSLGVEFVVRRVAGNNRWAVIGVRAARADNAP